MSGRGQPPHRGKSRHAGHDSGGHHGGQSGHHHFHPYSPHNPPPNRAGYHSGPGHMPRHHQHEHGRSQWRGQTPNPVNFQTQQRSLADEAEHLMYVRKLDEARQLVGLVRDEPESTFQWGRPCDPVSLVTGLPLTPAQLDKIKSDREKELAYARLPQESPEKLANPFGGSGDGGRMPGGPMESRGTGRVPGGQIESRGREQPREDVFGRMDGKSGGSGGWNEDGENSGKRVWSGENRGDRNEIRNQPSLHNYSKPSLKSTPSAPPVKAAPVAVPFVSHRTSLKRKLLEESTKFVGLPASLRQTANTYLPSKIAVAASRQALDDLFSDQDRRSPVMSQEEIDRAQEIADGEAQMADFDCYDEEEEGEIEKGHLAPEVIDDVSMGIDDRPDEELSGLASKLTELSLKSNPELLSFSTSGPTISLLPIRTPLKHPLEKLSPEGLSQALQRLTTQPTRWLAHSIHMYPSCAESNDVLSLARKLYEVGLQGGISGCLWIPKRIAAIQHLINVLKPGKERTKQMKDLPIGQLLQETFQLFGVSPLNQFLMRPWFCQKEDRIVDLMALREEVERKERRARKKAEKGEVVEKPRGEGDGTGRPDGVSCAACAVWDNVDQVEPVPLSGLDAGLLWRIRRGQGEGDEVLENLRFCGEHAGAVIGRDFCPLCLQINETDLRNENFQMGGMYCSGPNDNERHFFHSVCASKKSHLITCPHCGNSDPQYLRGWDPLDVDWRLKRSPFPEGKKIFTETRRHLTAGLCQDSAKIPSPSMDTTVAIWRPADDLKKSFPLQSGLGTTDTKSKKKSFEGRFPRQSGVPIREVVPVKNCFIPSLQHFFRDNFLLPSSTDLIEKYAAPLMSLSGERSGCLCRSECIPDICPCAQWMSPEMHYNPVDGTLRFGQTPKLNFIRECSEVCMCCVDKCCNRVTQMPSKVVARTVTKKNETIYLKTSHPIKSGQFICRIGGTLAEDFTKTEANIPDAFLLPKFGLWPDPKRSLMVKTVVGLAKDFRIVKKTRPTVMPVLILQAPISILLNLPQQLVVPTVAFFATRYLPAGSILSYEDDFRNVNANCPSHCRLPEGAAAAVPVDDCSLVYERQLPSQVSDGLLGCNKEILRGFSRREDFPMSTVI